MPWKETTTMVQKVEFISEWLTQKYTVTELCRAFEISRLTAYKLIIRYEQKGIKGLLDQSRSPINHPNRTDLNVEKKMISLRRKHSGWGAKKIHRLLFNEFTSELIPFLVRLQKREGYTIT